MSTFEWKLTPTERRIAEAAFGAGPAISCITRAQRACDAIFDFRGVSLSPDAGHRAAMLAELRREPEHVHCPDGFELGTLRLRIRDMRALLERIAAEADSATIDDIPAATSRWQPLLAAVYAARDALERKP